MLFTTAAFAGTGCGKHCGNHCGEEKPSLRDRLHDRFDRPRDTPPEPRRTDPSIFNNPAAPPGVIPPRESVVIPPTSVPTTPGAFDPGVPLGPPIRNNFRPDPIPAPVP